MHEMCKALTHKATPSAQIQTALASEHSRMMLYVSGHDDRAAAETMAHMPDSPLQSWAILSWSCASEFSLIISDQSGSSRPALLFSYAHLSQMVEAKPWAENFACFKHRVCEPNLCM